MYSTLLTNVYFYTIASCSSKLHWKPNTIIHSIDQIGCIKHVSSNSDDDSERKSWFYH